MPNIAVHLRLAAEALRHWRAHPELAPFDPDDPELANAFRHGALAPDLGYLPGGDTRFSDLAHKQGTGDLLRELLRNDSSHRGRAFAFGWLTHVLGDVVLHPHVNEAAFLAAVRLGSTPMIEHIRIERGMDVACLAEHPALRRIRLRPFLDMESVEPLAAAATRVHGRAPDRGRLLRAHWLLALGCTPLLRLTRGRQSASRTEAVAGTRRAVTSTPRSCIAAFLSPLSPPPFLSRRIAALATNFPEILQPWVDSDLLGLPNFDLEQGWSPGGGGAVA